MPEPDPQAAPAPKPKKTSFAGDVLKLVSGTTFAQALAVLAAPVLTRLFAPEAFGVQTLFLSMVSIVTVIACLRYELAIMLPESDEEAANLVGASLLFVTVISLLAGLALWAGGASLAALLNMPQIEPYLWLIPPSIFLSGVFLALNYWNTRSKRFGRLSIARISSSSITTGTQLGAGFAGLAQAGSLIGAHVLGSLVSTAVLAGQIWRDDQGLFRSALRWERMAEGIRRYRKFPIFSTWTAFLNNLSWQLPAFLLAAYFSPAVVGYYALGTRLLRLPMSLVGGAIAQVFFQRAAEAKNDGTLGLVVESVFRRLVMLGMFPLLLLALLGRDVFVVVFGEAWAEAGVYTQLLSLWMFLWFLSSPLSTLFSVLEMQEFGLKVNLVNFALRFGALWIGGAAGDARLAVLLFGLSGVLVYGYLNLAIMLAAQVPLGRIGRVLGAGLLAFAPAGAGLLLLRSLGLDPAWLVGLAGLALLGYYAWALRSDPELGELLRKMTARGQNALRRKKTNPADERTW